MTLEDFSNQFDVLIDSYRRFVDFDNKMPADTLDFDEYTKSVYLTLAQNELVVSLYNGKLGTGDSFESNEETRRYLSNLVRYTTLTPITTQDNVAVRVNGNYTFSLPVDLWFITYESVNVSNPKCADNISMDVYPVTQDDYLKTKRNPFRGANDLRALRLDLADGVVEIDCKYNITSYFVKYLKKPKPIILVDLPNGLTIDGEVSKQECKLHDALHKKILQGAVVMAMQSRGVKMENSK